MQPLPLVDAHVHLGPALTNWTHPPPVSAETGEQLIEILDESGIDRACVFAPSWEGGEFDDAEYHLANRAVADAASAHPERLTGICRINPNFATSALDEMRRCHDEYGFGALKLHPDWEFFSIHTPMMRPFLDLAETFGWPIFLHSGFYPLSQPALVLPVAQQYPDMRFVLLHLGHRFVTDAIVVAERCPNVFLETSADASPTAIAEVINRLGPGRLIFGSNTPSTHPSEVIAKIRMQPGLSQTDVGRILGGNLLSLMAVGGSQCEGFHENEEEMDDV